MTIDIEPCESTTGWTSTGTITASLCQFPEFIALHKTASLIFNIPAGNLNKSISKTLSVPMAGSTEIVLSVWSQGRASNSYQRYADFSYLIEFAAGVSFYMPIPEGFSQVSFYVPSLATVTRLKITPLHDNADYIVISACVGVKDDYPRDVMAGVQSEILRHVALEAGNGVQVGTVTGTTGDSSITVGELDYIDRMATVKIKDGTNSEVHAIARTDKSTYHFASVYDGDTLLHDYSAAPLYLNLPVEFGRYDEDAVMPGIFIWKMAPDPIQRSSDVDTVTDSVSAAGLWQARRVPLNLVYHLMVDCEARHPEILAILNRAVRRWLGSNILWINGRLHTFEFSIAPVEIEPDQSVEQFPKVQYTVDIEVQEEREDRAGLVGLSAATVSVDPVGEIA